MIYEMDNRWVQLIRMGRIHRGNRLINKKNLKICETFCEDECSKYCDGNKSTNMKEEKHENNECDEDRNEENPE